VVKTPALDGLTKKSRLIGGELYFHRVCLRIIHRGVKLLPHRQLRRLL
jgi:hypothetical protein